MAYSRSDLDDSDFEIINGRKCLKDGRALRVPVTLLDGMQRSVRDGVRVTDAGNGGSRPGYRFLGRETGDGSIHDAVAHRNRLLQDEKAKAHAEYHDRLVNAWRGDDADEDEDLPLGTPYVGAKAGQACTSNGRPGTLLWKQGGLYCVPNDSVTDARRRPDPLDPEDGDFDTDEQAAIKAFRKTQAYSNKPNYSAPARDRRSVADQQKAHAALMDKIYAAEDVRLRDAWKE